MIEYSQPVRPRFALELLACLEATDPSSRDSSSSACSRDLILLRSRNICMHQCGRGKACERVCAKVYSFSCSLCLSFCLQISTPPSLSVSRSDTSSMYNVEKFDSPAMLLKHLWVYPSCIPILKVSCRSHLTKRYGSLCCQPLHRPRRHLQVS